MRIPIDGHAKWISCAVGYDSAPSGRARSAKAPHSGAASRLSRELSRSASRGTTWFIPVWNTKPCLLPSSSLWAKVIPSGARLVRHRTLRGISQSAFVRELGVDPGTLGRWERDKQQPTGAHMELVRHRVR
jgi:hypothetical protein